MIYMGLDGVFGINGTIYVYSITDTTKVVVTINLCTVLYTMNIVEGRPLFVEIHQAAPLMNVNMVVGKTMEAIERVDTMNKNVAASVKFHFPIEDKRQSHSGPVENCCRPLAY